MKKKLLAGLAIGVMMIGMTGVANAISIAQYEVQGHPNVNDTWVGVVGVGNISTPIWQQQVALNVPFAYSSITLPDNFVWGNTWWLHAAVDGDDGNIMTFNIVTDIGTYSAQGLPIFVQDQQDSYAFINMPQNMPQQNPVPEPATMLLMGTGLAGLIGARREKRK